MSEKKLRVLHIIPSLAKGGAERLVSDICRQLNLDETIELKLVVLSPINEYEETTRGIDIKVCPSYIVPSILKPDKIDLKEYQNILNDFRPHIVHSHLFQAEIVSREVINPSIVYITHCHSNISQYKNLSLQTFLDKSLLTNFYEKQRIQKRYKECNNHFIAISNDNKRYLSETLNVKDEDVTLLPNAIDLEKFSEGENKSDNEIKLISIGNLNKNKNHSFLIGIVSDLIKKNINCSLTILGDGDERANLEKQIKILGLEEKVILKGKVNNPEVYLKESHIYLHSSLTEAFGLSMVEAMACGLPVVALDAGGNRDIIVSGYNGFLINQRDSKDFESKVLLLATNKDNLNTFSKNAFQFSKKFDMKNYTQSLISLYNKLHQSKETLSANSL